MAQELGPLRDQRKAVGFWWIAIPAFILAICNAAFAALLVVRYYADYLRDAFGLTFGFLGSESDAALYLQYILLVVFSFFLFGLVHGRRTKRVRVTVLLSFVVAVASGVPAFMILPAILALVVGGESGLIILMIVGYSPFFLSFLMVVGTGVGSLGGLIANRLLGRRPRPEEVTSL